MTDIKFKLVDGEPVCSADDGDCPHYTYYDGERCALICGGEVMWPEPNDETGVFLCWPGVRQQRDEARREVCETGLAVVPSEWAKMRGWEHLYKDDPSK